MPRASFVINSGIGQADSALPAKAGCKFLTYYEQFNSILDAIAREPACITFAKASVSKVGRQEGIEGSE